MTIRGPFSVIISLRLVPDPINDREHYEVTRTFAPLGFVARVTGETISEIERMASA
jgi:hypothetical protein